MSNPCISIPANFHFTERGNTAFADDGGKAVIFKKMPTEDESVSIYLQAAHTPGNYPSWEVGFLTISEAELVKHIQDNLSGWLVMKYNLDIEIEMDGDQVA
jgi:hypothetical protein